MQAMISRKTAALGGLGILALLAGGQNTRAAEGSGPDAAVAAVPSSVDELVVTARLRPERVIDVPLSVQALNATTLQQKRIENVNDLYAVAPNLYFSSNLLSPGRDFINLVVRGVGAESAGQPAVATIVDGVYQPSLAFDTAFLGADRVELLRGPQGTLFGRNTEGGALNIVLHRPGDQLEGRVAVTVDTLETARLQGSLSGPLGGGFSGGIAIDALTTNGYLSNPQIATATAAGVQSKPSKVSADDDRKLALRPDLRFHPADNLDVNLAVDWSNERGDSGLPGVPRGCGCYDVFSTFQVPDHYVNYGGALNIDYTVDGVHLKSITGVRRLSSTLPYDFSGGPVFGGPVYPNDIMDLRTQQKILSQEFRADGSGFHDALHWLAGAYLYSEEHLEVRRFSLPNLPQYPGGIFAKAEDQDLDSHGVALFVDANYKLTDRIEVDLGGRWSRDTTKSNFNLDVNLPGIADVVGTGAGSTSSQSFTPSASVLYRLAPDVNLYARYSQGYKAGSFPLAPSVQSNLPFLPERSSNYELGIKGSALEHRLQFDASAFYIDLTDQQVQTVVFFNGDPNLPIGTVGNAGKSSSRGYEASADLAATDQLKLDAGLGYTDAHYDQYIDTVGKDRSGEPFPFVPRYTAHADAQYTVPIGGGAKLTLAGGYQYVDPILSGTGVDIDLQFKVKAYSLVNARATLAWGSTKLDLYADNLLDKYIETKVFNSFFFLTPRPFSTVLPPRVIGARISYSF
jgi:iron complex outermembrane recepter protein